MRNLLLRAALPLAIAALLAVPAIASADSPSTLTVVGTSDVSDSGLMQNVVEPDFNALYPNITFKYIGTATGTAISDAEGGGQGASMLIVHAASLENQFVASGYSYNNQPGYAIFRNDFVLAGPSTSDPAGITSNGDTHNIVAAFIDVAEAGIAGDVTFVSRGGTPGTSVEEHAIWQLVYDYEQTNGQISGLDLCQVSTADGGGYTPVVDSDSDNGAACPSDILTAGNSDLPSWYAATGLTQGPNVLNADACDSAGYNAACYVFTDRGTYDYLAAGSDPAGSLSGSNPTNPLDVLVYDDSASAPGGADLLINYFHAYIISPTAVPTAGVNLTASQDLINLLTSPTFQAQLSSYLSSYTYTTSPCTSGTCFENNPLGAPFVADASPDLTQSGLSASVDYGKSVTVTGTLAPSEIGYPALADEKVTVDELVAGAPVAVASGHTTDTGSYSITFKPKSTGEYEVSTGQIVQVENSTLDPEYSDTLSPASTSAAKLTVVGAPVQHTLTIASAKATKAGKVTVKGALKPGPALAGAKVELLATSTSTGKTKQVGKASVGTGKTSFTVTGKLAKKKTYLLQLKYVQANQTTTYSSLKKVVVK